MMCMMFVCAEVLGWRRESGLRQTISKIAKDFSNRTFSPEPSLLAHGTNRDVDEGPDQNGDPNRELCLYVLKGSMPGPHDRGVASIWGSKWAELIHTALNNRRA